MSSSLSEEAFVGQSTVSTRMYVSVGAHYSCVYICVNAFWGLKRQKESQDLQYIISEQKRLGPHMLLDRAGLYDEKQTHENFSWPKLFYFNYFSTKKSGQTFGPQPSLKLMPNFANQMLLGIKVRLEKSLFEFLAR